MPTGTLSCRSSRYAKAPGPRGPGALHECAPGRAGRLQPCRTGFDSSRSCLPTWPNRKAAVRPRCARCPTARCWCKSSRRLLFVRLDGVVDRTGLSEGPDHRCAAVPEVRFLVETLTTAGSDYIGLDEERPNQSSLETLITKCPTASRDYIQKTSSRRPPRWAFIVSNRRIGRLPVRSTSVRARATTARGHGFESRPGPLCLSALVAQQNPLATTSSPANTDRLPVRSTCFRSRGLWVRIPPALLITMAP